MNNEKTNPESLHAFWIFQKILQGGCPLGRALEALVAAAGAPITIMDIYKTQFRQCHHPKSLSSADGAREGIAVNLYCEATTTIT